MTLDRRSLLLATGAAAAILSGWTAEAEAQGYPERPITVIVPFSPGGSTDLVARAVLAKVEENLGESIVFDYRPGAGTQIGLNALATAEPDGYTLGMATSSAVLQPIFTETRFVYADELTPIAQFAATAQALFVHADSEWQTLEDLVEDARENPGSIQYGITGVGNSSHLGPAQIARLEDVDMPHVVFDGGSALLTALLGQHVPAASGSPVDYKEQVVAGDVRGLVSFATERSDDEALADIPTALELGYDFDMTSWTALAGPGGLPDDVMEVLSGAIEEAMADPEVQQAIRDLGSTPQYLDSQGLRERWDTARESWTEIVTETGILEMVRSQAN